MSASNKTLQDLHEALADTFLELIHSGDAKSADLNAARQFLRDNGIQDASDTSKLWHIKDHVEKVPFPTSEEVAEEAA